MNPVKLQEFLEFLHGQSQQDFKGESVSRFLRERTFESTAFSPFTFYRSDTYARNLVMKTDLFELIVLAWAPRQRTPIHDHANSRCWLWMMRGELTFRNYEFPDPSCNKGLICQGTTETRSVGEVDYIDDSMGIHSIANASNEPAVSVHLYAGPISRCQIYDEKAKTVGPRCAQRCRRRTYSNVRGLMTLMDSRKKISTQPVATVTSGVSMVEHGNAADSPATSRSRRFAAPETGASM